MLQVRRGERCLVIYDLVASFKAEKRKVGDVWFTIWQVFLIFFTIIRSGRLAKIR